MRTTSAPSRSISMRDSMRDVEPDNLGALVEEARDERAGLRVHASEYEDPPASGSLGHVDESVRATAQRFVRLGGRWQPRERRQVQQREVGKVGHLGKVMWGDGRCWQVMWGAGRCWQVLVGAGT